MDTKSNKLPEGWHNTEKYGQVFITPDGSAWTIKSVNNQLQSTQVNISQSDIISTTAIDRTKHNQRMRIYRKSKAPVISPSNLTPQAPTHD